MVCFFLTLIYLQFKPSDKQNIDMTGLQAKLKVGDWIVREGVGYESILIKKMSQSDYSHIGVIVEIYPEIKIVHATTDDHPDRLNQIVVSTLSEFVDVSRSHQWAIYRHEKLTQQQRESVAFNILNQLGQAFILDIKQKPHRYCSTVIAEQLPKQQQQILKWSPVEFPGIHGELLFPNALISLKGVQNIYIHQ